MKSLRFLIPILYVLCFSCYGLKTNNKKKQDTKKDISRVSSYTPNAPTANGNTALSEEKTQPNFSKAGVYRTGDTIKMFTYDTIIKNNFNSDYIRQQNIIDLFSPFFEKDICEPGNYNHPKYRSFISHANSLIANTKRKIWENIRQNPKYKSACHDTSIEPLAEQMRDISELKNCTFIPLPVYYPTLNIVLYSNEPNIKQFFDLDTSAIIYRVFKNNKMIGFIKRFTNGVSKIQCYYPEDSLSYNMVVELNKEPIGIKRNSFKGSFENFGCLINNHLVFALCSQGNEKRVNENTGEIVKDVFNRECHMITADEYYLNSNSGRSYLSKWVEDVYEVLKIKRE